MREVYRCARAAAACINLCSAEPALMIFVFVIESLYSAVFMPPFYHLPFCMSNTYIVYKIMLDRHGKGVL